jgi:type II secretion system protein N
MRRPAIICALGAGALLLFASVLIATFPYDQMASSILAPYQLKLTYRAQHLHLPLGVALEGVDIVSVAASPNQLVFRSPVLAMRPTIGSLLLGQPGLGVDAEVYRGILHATFRQTDRAIDLTFDANALDLADTSIFNQYASQVTGKLWAQGAAQLHGTGLAGSAGQVTVSGRNVTIEITDGFPPIHLGIVTGKFDLANNVLNFHDVETHGGDLEAKADGVIQLGDDPQTSTIAARVALAPTPSGRDHFGLLFHMLPHPPSEGPYQVHGSLAEPSIN